MDVRTAAEAGALRWLRAAVLATVALLTGVVAHASAGERLPSAVTLLGLLAVVTFAVGLLLRDPASTRRIVLLLAAGETFIHLALSGLAGSFLTGPVSGVEHANHQDHLLSADALRLPGWLVDGLAAMTGQHVLMAEAHLLAALALGLWLAAGERALWTLLCLTLRPVTTAVAGLLAAYRCQVPAGAGGSVSAVIGDRDQLAPALSVRACRVVSRRGPPLGSPCLLAT